MDIKHVAQGLTHRKCSTANKYSDYTTTKWPNRAYMNKAILFRLKSNTAYLFRLGFS